MNRPMKVAVLSAKISDKYLNLLDKKLNELIETSQCYLFYILCGFTEGRNDSPKTLGELWAEKRGAPTLYISEKTTDALLRKTFLVADYVIFLIDGNPIINKALMQYKMMGKHGSVIKVNE